MPQSIALSTKTWITRLSSNLPIPESALFLTTILAIRSLIQERRFGKNGRLKSIHRRALWLASIACLSAYISMGAAVNSSDEARLRALTERFFAAVQKEDLDGLMQMWSTSSPELAASKKVFQQMFALNDKIEIKNLTVRKEEFAGEKATLHVTFDFSAAEIKTGKPSAESGKQNRTFVFIKEDDEWKIWEYKSSEAVLAAALLAAKGNDERESLLAAKKELVSPVLVQALLLEGDRFYHQRSSERAFDSYGFARALAEQLQDRIGIADALRRIGNIYLAQGNHIQALKQFQESLTISDKIGYRGGIAKALNNIGIVHYHEGNHTQALEHYQSSLKITEELGDKDVAAKTLSNIANIHALQGNYTQALEQYQKSLKIRLEIRDESGVGDALANIGNVHRSQGNYVLALDHYQQSLRIRQEIDDKRGIAQTFNNIALVHRLQGDHAQALEVYQESLEIKEEMRDKKGIATTRYNIGFLYYLQGSYAQALECYQKSLTISAEISDKAVMAGALNGIGDVNKLKQNYTEALEYYGKSLHISRELGHKEAMAETLTNIGIVQRLQGNHTQARQNFADAIAAVEELRVRVAGDEQQQQLFFANKLSPYHQMIELLIDDKKSAEALGYVERFKARALLDTLETGRVDVTKAMTESERAKERRLMAEIVSVNTQIHRKNLRRQPDNEVPIGLEARLEKARADYEAFQINLYAAHPQLKIQRGNMQPIGMKQAGSLIKDVGAAVLEFVVTEDKTFLFTLTRPRRQPAAGRPPVVNVYTVNIQQKELAERVKRFRGGLIDRDLGIGNEAKALYDLLLGAARSELADKTTLIIIPDGPLWELPFQALKPEPKRFLVEDCALSYAPSLTTLFHMTKAGARHRKRPETLLAIGNPAVGQETAEAVQSLFMDERLRSLPEAERLVKTVGQKYGSRRSTVYIGAEAREDRVKREAPKHGIIHIAAHGILNDKSPMYSHLVLSQAEGNRGEDGLLEAWEVMNLKLNAVLVILSACETARGRIGNGEGVIGLSWASFIAGAATTVVSQWKVESSSTTELMIEFHHNLRMRKTKSEALRSASLKLLKTERYHHPFYWAGFVIIGDAR